MTRKTSVAALFLLVACLVPRMSVAGTVTLTLEPSSGSPYDFSINGSKTLTDLSCLNNNRTVYTYESWTATDVNLGTLTSTDSKSTNVGGVSVLQLEEDAYLFSKYTSNDTSTTNTEVQDAIWSILDGNLGHNGTYVYTGLSGGLNGTEDKAVQNYVAAAASFAAATSGTSSFYSDFTYYYPQTWGNDSDPNHIPQQFLGHSPAVTPEPSSLILLGTGIIGLAGAMRRRLMAANQA